MALPSELLLHQQLFPIEFNLTVYVSSNLRSLRDGSVLPMHEQKEGGGYEPNDRFIVQRRGTILPECRD